MTLRKKIFFIVAYAVEGTMIVLYAGISFFFLGNLIDNEQEDVRRNVEWVGRAIRQDIADMNRQILDWSHWDDMYAFADAPTESFIESNLPVESLDILDLSFIVIADRDGKILAGQGMDRKTREKLAVPSEVEKQVALGNILSTFASPSDGHSGIILFASGPALIATRPIVTSLGEGPPRGAIAFVRMLDDGYRRGLSDFLGYPLAFSFVGSNNFSSDFSEAAKELRSPEDVKTSVGETSISGYGFLPDVFGSPLLFYRLEKAIPTSFGTSKLMAALSLIGFLLVATLLIFFLLHWTVLSRVNFLSRSLAHARRKGLSKEGIDFSGSDEIADLAKEINALLSAFLSVRERGDVAERRFETIADTIPAFLWMIGTNQQCLYVNKQASSCIGAIAAEEFMEAWRKHIHPDDVAGCLARCASAFERRKPLTMEYRVVCSGGGYRWVLDSSVPFSSSVGVFLGFLHVAVDITDRKDSEEKEVSKRKEAERLNAIMVSRELRMIELKKEIKELRGKKESHS
jgi:PAS domain S-box-containing protein